MSGTRRKAGTTTTPGNGFLGLRVSVLTAGAAPLFLSLLVLSGTLLAVLAAPPAAASGDCSENYSEGTLVTLTATPANGSRFTAWGGACSGTASTSELTMDAAKAVTATFANDVMFKDGF